MIQYGPKQGLGMKAWGLTVVIVLHAIAGYILITGLGTAILARA